MKDFKMAHIVPVAQFNSIANNHYHMCLAHLVHNDAYAAFYKKMSAEGKYVLMDNGAAEKSQLDGSELIKMYSEINPTEIVLPDVLNDGSATLAKTFDFIERYEHLPYKFMAVPQGKSFVEWQASATILLRCSRINSIGVSKFLNIATGDNKIRVKAVHFLDEAIKEMGRTDVEIHLLGCDEGPEIVNEAKNVSLFVRGCDTAFVYLAAQSGLKSIDRKTLRPTGEIDFINGPVTSEFGELATQFDRVVGAMMNVEVWRV